MVFLLIYKLFSCIVYWCVRVRARAFVCVCVCVYVSECVNGVGAKATLALQSLVIFSASYSINLPATLCLQ
jgi:hypothetical protein